MVLYIYIKTFLIHLFICIRIWIQKSTFNHSIFIFASFLWSFADKTICELENLLRKAIWELKALGPLKSLTHCQTNLNFDLLGEGKRALAISFEGKCHWRLPLHWRAYIYIYIYKCLCFVLGWHCIGGNKRTFKLL